VWRLLGVDARLRRARPSFGPRATLITLLGLLTVNTRQPLQPEATGAVADVVELRGLHSPASPPCAGPRPASVFSSRKAVDGLCGEKILQVGPIRCAPQHMLRSVASMPTTQTLFGTRESDGFWPPTQSFEQSFEHVPQHEVAMLRILIPTSAARDEIPITIPALALEPLNRVEKFSSIQS
jgi:hypothetical protein